MAKNSKGLLLGILGIGGLVLLSRKAFAMPAKKYGAPLQLTKNFNLSEFLDEHDFLKSYKLDQEQFDSVTRLARLLQRARDKFGQPLNVQSGCRPPDAKDAQGRNLETILREKGYFPSKNSDHSWCGAADLGFNDGDTKQYTDLAIYLARQPETRQVILELKQAKDGTGLKPMAVHVAVMAPGHSKIQGDNYAFVRVDDKRVGSLDWQPRANDGLS